jgi:DNA repair exonuclease SbcCD ATPase subunit
MILFKTIRWKNLLSTGNFFTEIHLNKSPNTLVIGTNGAGKSTILDALCFGLFGRPFRKIKKDLLLNSINNKDCVVELEFDIGDREYKIIRGIKPNVFEIYCNGNLVDQDAKCKDYQEHLENLILRLNYKTFTQVVVLGSASFTPFMQLSPTDRRTIIEDLLDIEIFSTMNTLVKLKLSELKELTQQNKFDTDLIIEKINLQKQNIEEHKKHNEEEVKNKQDEINTNNEQIIKLQSDIGLVQKHIEQLQSKVSDKETVSAKSKKLVQVEAKLEGNKNKIKKDIQFYEVNDHCPTCKQDLDTDFKTEQVKERNAKLTEIEDGIVKLEEALAEVNTRITEINNTAIKISEHQSEIIKMNSSIQSINKYIVKLNTEINLLVTKKDNMEVDNEKLKELRDNLTLLTESQKEVSTEKHYYDFASSLLKDTGIKTKIIKQYLPVMNKLINKYLASMNFFVDFNINESFEETIKSRYRDEFSYYNFSEGEKFRIDLALLFTWRQIARLKNSANTNLLILDEVFDSSLDTGGTDEFMKLIHELGNDSNVFVISHKGDQLFDKFRSVVKFQKRNNFSEVVR